MQARRSIWIGGLFLIALLYILQWRSLTRLIEEISASGLAYEPYGHAVAEFAAINQRFPRPDEIQLPPPPAGGLIRTAELHEHGVLHLNLSAWSWTGGATATLAPRVILSELPYPTGQIHFACVAVRPSALRQGVCRSVGWATLESVARDNDTAFSTWRAKTMQRAQTPRAVEDPTPPQTECDRIAARVHGILQCITSVDPESGAALAKSIDRLISRPRLRPEVIALNPEFLARFDRSCREEWEQTAALLRSARAEAADCLNR